MVIEMLTKEVETLVTNLYNTNQNLITICLLDSNGNISLFLSKNNVEEGEKKRLAASIMASVVLAERSIVNLIQENVKHVIIKGEHAMTIIFTTKSKDYVYIEADLEFDYKDILKLDLNF